MAVEVEIIKYEGDIKDLQKQQRAAEQGFTSLEKKAKTSTDNVKGTFNNLGSSIKNALSSLPIGGLVNDLDNAASAARGVATGLNTIPGSADKGIKSVNLLGSALKVGVLGVLGLIIVAFSAVVNFFKQTDEGALRLEATMNGLSAATDVLKGRLSQFGSDLVDAFDSAEESTGFFSGTFGKLLLRLIPGLGVIQDLSDAVGDSGLGKDMKAAYDAGVLLTFQMDAIQDSMRVLGVETRQTELQIAALLKQTRNKGLDIGERLNIVSEAFELENKNLSQNFELQKQYYENVAQTNFLLTKTINSRKVEQVAAVEAIVNQIKFAKNADELLSLYQQQIKAQEGLKTINDELSDKQASSLTQLVELSGKSQIAEEKYAAIRSNLVQKDLAERVEAIKTIEAQRTTVAINTIKEEQALAKKTLDIQVGSLNDQRDIYEQFHKDKLLGDDEYKKATSAIDLEIAKLKQKHAEDLVKIAKEANEKKLKNDKDNSERYKLLVDAENALELQRAQFALKNAQAELGAENKTFKERVAIVEKIKQAQLKQAFDEYQISIKNKNLTVDERTRIEEKYAQDIVDINRTAQGSIQALEQQTADKRKMLADFAIQSAGQVIDEVYNRQSTARGEELTAAQEEADRKIKNLQREKDQGVITEQQYNAKVARIESDKARKEKEVKRQQAIADKQQALFSILINTAVAVVKSLPNPFLVALSIATGAVQAALVASRPIPKFAKGVIDLQGAGTKTSDSITAKLSKGESVMTADETSEHKGLFKAIRNNQFDRHVNEAWVLPAIRKLERQRAQKESFRDRSMNRLSKRIKEVDLEHLERLTARNNQVRVGNVDELADAINRRKGHRGIV